MIGRYTRPAMGRVWSEQHRYEKAQAVQAEMQADLQCLREEALRLYPQAFEGACKVAVALAAFFHGNLSADGVTVQLQQCACVLHNVGMGGSTNVFDKFCGLLSERGEWPSPQAAAWRGLPRR